MYTNFRVLSEAFYVARSGRPGPVVVDLPKDVMNAETNYERLGKIEHRSYRPVTHAERSAVEDAVTLVESAERPIIYSGGGIINSGNRASELLKELARVTGFPVTNTLMGLGDIPATTRNSLGCSVCMGLTRLTWSCTSVT